MEISLRCENLVKTFFLNDAINANQMTQTRHRTIQTEDGDVNTYFYNPNNCVRFHSVRKNLHVINEVVFHYLQLLEMFSVKMRFVLKLCHVKGSLHR